MRDAVQRMRLERRLALVFLAAVLLLFALMRLFGGPIPSEAPAVESNPAVGSVPIEAAGEP